LPVESCSQQSLYAAAPRSCPSVFCVHARRGSSRRASNRPANRALSSFSHIPRKLVFCQPAHCNGQIPKQLAKWLARLTSTQIIRSGRTMITRRQSLKRLLGVGAATLAAPMINRSWFQLFAETTTKYSARAIDLVQRGTIVDMLNPFTLLGVLAPFKGDKRPTWFTNPETFTAADFQRFKDSRIDAMQIGVGTTGPNAYDQVMWFLGLWNGFIAHHGEHLMRVD